MKKILKMSFGKCPCCGKRTLFKSHDYNYREYYQCVRCGSNPRQRAIIKVIQDLYPNWLENKIHESSPSGATFQKMLHECKDYSYSYFYPQKELGELLNGSNRVTNQNLESLTFSDESFDLFITQDVLEHINEPPKALKEIYRCLKPGGSHIFTVPVSPFQITRPRIKIEHGKVIPIMEEVYHGNPISEKGSLVTYDWGGDILSIIDSIAPFKTDVISFYPTKENHLIGVDAMPIFIFVSTKTSNVD